MKLLTSNVLRHPVTNLPLRSNYFPFTLFPDISNLCCIIELTQNVTRIKRYIRSREEDEEEWCAVSTAPLLEPANRFNLLKNFALRSEGVVQNFSRSLFYKL
jgi:hypothetical protein